MRAVILEPFNHSLHKRVWRYLANHPTKTREDWPGWDIINHRLDEGLVFKGVAFSPACEYVRKRHLEFCGGCPIDYKGDHDLCHEFFALKSKKERRKRARLIQRLPVRKGVPVK